MRKLLIVALLLNAGFLFAIWQQLSVVAEVGGGGLDSPCETDQTKYSLDTNDDGGIDLSDFVYGLSWFFSGTEAPRVCLATDALEARLAALENQHPVDWTDIQNRPAGLDDGDDVGLTTVDWNDLVNVPAGFADGVDDDSVLSEAQVDAFADNNGYITTLVPEIAGFTFVETNAQGYPEYTHDSSGIRFVRLPGGSFDMGSPASEGGATSEQPVHTVSLSPFLIAKYEVTQAEYEAVMMTNPPGGLSATPSSATGDDLPVEQVSLDDLHIADGFLERTELSLPSEAQWEYACRAGTPGPYSGTGLLDDMGWYLSNSGSVSHDVGTKQANQFGLHDLHGNVWDLCEDVFKSDFYSDDVPGFDPLSTSGSPNRVIRGGSFVTSAVFCRSADRGVRLPDGRGINIGFRPARPLP